MAGTVKYFSHICLESACRQDSVIAVSVGKWETDLAFSIFPQIGLGQLSYSILFLTVKLVHVQIAFVKYGGEVTQHGAEN